MSEYYIPSAPGETEFTEKRSRFLGHVRCVETEDEAKASDKLVQDLTDKFIKEVDTISAEKDKEIMAI